MNDDTRYGLTLCGAIFAFLGALILVGWATVSYGYRCDDRACVHEGLATWQLIVAVAGLVPAGFAVLTAFAGRGRLVLVWLGVTAVTYLLWGVLNDASVHGWDDFKVF